MKTYIANPEAVESTHAFHLIDAEGLILGRLASAVANLLTGKNKPIYTPFLDTGDHVIIINADKIRLTGNKLEDKYVIYHTLYPGGFRKKPYSKALAERPEKIILKAVWGMLPKSKLGRKMLKKLRVYHGPEHPHAAQNPVPYVVK